MKALIYSTYGSSNVLEMKEVEKPVPKDNEVLIKVCAASINDYDWGLLQGKPFVNRLMNGLLRPKKFRILGSDIAGRIEAVGKDVKRFKIGDAVYGDLTDRWGGFAEYVCAPETALIIKPDTMTFEDAAAIPQAAMLAVQGLIDKGQIRQGQSLLINGAGGGVGTFGVQIANTYGVEVTGVDSTEKLQTMLDAGYDHVIDYTRTDFAKNELQYDLILDNKINRPIAAHMKALKPNGTYVTTGGSTGRIFQAFLLGPLLSAIYKKNIHVVILVPNKDLPYMNELFQAGQLKPVIDGPYRFCDAIEAMGRFEEGKHKGKIVITMDACSGE